MTNEKIGYKSSITFWMRATCLFFGGTCASLFNTFGENYADAGVLPNISRQHSVSLYSEVIAYPEDQSKSGISVLETVLLMNEIESMLRRDIQRVSTGFQWDFHWDKPWLGAGSVLTYERVFRVMLWGGIVRAEKMTPQGLEAVLCHEFGHLLGGTPKQIFPAEGEHWSSTEGQSDWWAATVCLPRLYQSRGLAPAEISDRIKRAGLDFVLFAHFHFEKDSPLPSLNLEAQEAPIQTLTLAYPTLQCRLDTYRLGAESRPETTPESTSFSTLESGPIASFVQTPPVVRPRCWFAD